MIVKCVKCGKDIDIEKEEYIISIENDVLSHRHKHCHKKHFIKEEHKWMV